MGKILPGGATRTAENRAIRREALREQLKSSEYLRQVEIILAKPPAQWKKRGQEFDIKLKTYFRLLAKTLPDVKQIELKTDADPTDNMTPTQIRERLKKLLSEQPAATD